MGFKSDLKKHRTERGLRKKDLADAAGVAEKTVDRAEKGAAGLDEVSLRKIFNALNKVDGFKPLEFRVVFPGAIGRKKK